MEIFGAVNSDSFIAECLASLSWALRLALDSPDGVTGNELAGAAFILSSLQNSFAQRLNNQEAAARTAPED